MNEMEKCLGIDQATSSVMNLCRLSCTKPFDIPVSQVISNCGVMPCLPFIERAFALFCKAVLCVYKH